MSLVFTSSSTSVTMTYDPIVVAQTVSKNLKTIVFSDGTDTQMDKGRNVFRLNISGIETSGYVDKMKWLNYIMDQNSNVLVSGLVDSNLNKYYFITDLGFFQNPGESFYRYNMVLERLYEEV